jgi:hypothetical protein
VTVRHRFLHPPRSDGFVIYLLGIGAGRIKVGMTISPRSRVIAACRGAIHQYARWRADAMAQFASLQSEREAWTAFKARHIATVPA